MLKIPSLIKISNLLKEKRHRHSGLLIYTLFNYIDKFFVFTAPLIVLWIFQDKPLYNEVEYIYSLAGIVAVLIELGIRNYFLYDYKHSNDRNSLTKKIDSYFALQFVVYFVIGLALTTVSFLINQQFGYLLFFVLVRALFSYFISFYNLYYRLVDSPSRIFAYSISINIITIVVTLLYWKAFATISIQIVLLAQVLFVIAAAINFLKLLPSVKLSDFFDYSCRSFKYAWPIILNICLFMFISNYGKIYARNILGPDEMTHISLVQRLALLIQLGHASASGYLSKKMFLDTTPGINKKLLLIYSGMIWSGVIMSIISVVVINTFIPNISIELDIITFLIIGYTVAWCYSAYFELYLSKINKNIYIPIFTGISACGFVFFVVMNFYDPLTNISLGMFFSMVLNCSLIVLVLLKYGGGSQYVKESPALVGDASTVE